MRFLAWIVRLIILFILFCAIIPGLLGVILLTVFCIPFIASLLIGNPLLVWSNRVINIGKSVTIHEGITIH